MQRIRSYKFFFFTFFPDYFNYFSCLIPLATTTLFVVRVNILGWLENIKNNQAEIKNTISEIKNTLGIFYIPTVGINSRLNVAEWISVLEDRVLKITAAGWQQQKRTKRNEGTLIDLWNRALIFTLFKPQKAKRDKRPEKIIEEIITENFHNMRKEKVTQVHELQEVP